MQSVAARASPEKEEAVRTLPLWVEEQRLGPQVRLPAVPHSMRRPFR